MSLQLNDIVARRNGRPFTKGQMTARVVALGPLDSVTTHDTPRMAQVDGTRFRLLDDDGEVYYVGRFFGDPDSQEAFGPLDDFGEPAAGCTTIQYHRNEQWETL